MQIPCNAVRLFAALIREATSLIRPVRLPVIRFGEESINSLNYLRFVLEKAQKTGLESPISLYFSLLAGSGL